MSSVRYLHKNLSIGPGVPYTETTSVDLGREYCLLTHRAESGAYMVNRSNCPTLLEAWFGTPLNLTPLGNYLLRRRALAPEFTKRSAHSAQGHDNCNRTARPYQSIYLCGAYTGKDIYPTPKPQKGCVQMVCWYSFTPAAQNPKLTQHLENTTQLLKQSDSLCGTLTPPPPRVAGGGGVFSLSDHLCNNMCGGHRPGHPHSPQAGEPPRGFGDTLGSNLGYNLGSNLGYNLGGDL